MENSELPKLNVLLFGTQVHSRSDYVLSNMSTDICAPSDAAGDAEEDRTRGSSGYGANYCLSNMSI